MLQLVQDHAPITGEQIAEQLGVSRPTIRSDLSILVMLGHLDAKPKVGYFLGKQNRQENLVSPDVLVRDVQMPPIIVRETATVSDAAVALFLGNTGVLIVTDEDGVLLGVISSKDLLKVTIGNPSAATLPVGVVMTRMPNIVTVTPEDHLLDVARKMDDHHVSTLPVVVPYGEGKSSEKWEVVGRISKTTVNKVILKLAK
ncbi:CBS domain-containing protein [Paenibacillus sp. GCM10027629]|uniref:CBS domain-containing protein n=1 Tax=Paenibacillus sp. GCM10027629 TaxID=3273414 RepID=UPI0036294CEF